MRQIDYRIKHVLVFFRERHMLHRFDSVRESFSDVVHYVSQFLNRSRLNFYLDVVSSEYFVVVDDVRVLFYVRSYFFLVVSRRIVEVDVEFEVFVPKFFEVEFRSVSDDGSFFFEFSQSDRNRFWSQMCFMREFDKRYSGVRRYELENFSVFVVDSRNFWFRDENIFFRVLFFSREVCFRKVRNFRKRGEVSFFDELTVLFKEFFPERVHFFD